MSKNVGGYIRGPWWRYNGEDDERTRRCFVIAWGHVVQHPEEWYRDLRMIRFVIKTGRGAGRNEKHLVCVAYGASTAEAIMRAMEKGDIVLVCGTWVEKPYNTKKGPKVGYECRVNFIVPQELIGFLFDLSVVHAQIPMGLPRFLQGLYMDDNLRQIAEKNVKKHDESDPWEYDY